MKKHILIASFFIAFILPAMAQESDNGVIKKFYENGNLHITGFKINGKAGGIFVEYREDGSVRTIKEFKDNQLNGLFLGFHGNGVLDYRGEYLNGEAVGIHKVYDEEGRIIRLDLHDGDNKLQILFKDGKPVFQN